jgi:hypothetical protein
MQYKLTPAFITSLSTLVVAMDHNPVGGAYLVTLATLFMLNLTHNRK